MLKHFIILFLILSPTISEICFAQERNLTDSLLRHIHSLQVKENGYFMQGSFPSKVSKFRKPWKRKNDFNIFYNTLIGFTLNDIRNKLSTDEQVVCDSITSGLKGVYPHFRNKNGFNTYNFWRTDTILLSPFAAGKKKLSKHLYLPDDLDDAALAMLSMAVHDSIAGNVHELMQRFANDGNNINTHKKLRCIKKKYRKYGAYSVWFGKKFPMSFDICVLCNILTMVNHYHLAYTKADSASLQLIIAEIKNGDYIKRPLIVSPNYGNTSIILYHLARLMNSGKIPELDPLKPILIKTADSILARSNDSFEKVLISSSLIKWGAVVSGP